MITNDKITKLNFLDSERFSGMATRSYKTLVAFPEQFCPENTVSIGIDPGRNFGVSMVSDDAVLICWGKFPRLEDTDERPKPHLYGLYAYALIQTFLEEYCPHGFDAAVVEGAAYHSKYGETNLAYIRMGFFAGLSHWSAARINNGIVPASIVDVVAPATVRKLAFENGQNDGTLLLPLVNANAVASLGCGIAGVKMLEESRGA